MAGLLITFEGLDLSGKSSVLWKIIRDLIEEGFEIHTYREPGGTEIGDQIRDVVHSMKNHEIHPRTELLLYQASRAQLVNEVLRPGLEEGKIFIGDRFSDSTRAYQGGGRGIDMNEINSLIEFATGGLTPDLTILFDIPVEIRKERITKGREWNRMDIQDIPFYQAVREKYLQLASENVDGRWRVIDATQPLDEVVESVKTIVRDKIETHLSVEGQQKRGKETW